MDSRGYELPSLDNISTPQEAGEAINRIYADAMSDTGHPWVNGNHIQHRDFLKRVDELQQIKMRDDDMRSPLDQAMQKALDHGEQQQAARVEEGQKLMSELVVGGFDRAEVPMDITRYEIRGLSQQLMASRGEWDEALRQIQDDLGKLSPPEDISKLISIIRQTPDSEKSFRERLFSRLVCWIHKEKNRRYGRIDVF